MRLNGSHVAPFTFPVMKLDPKVTQQIQVWLNTPEADRDIRAGAELMLTLNRNRALYNSLLRRPDKFKDKLVYELKKHLRIRLDNLTTSEVARLEETIIPRIKETVGNPPAISVDAELPEGTVAKGRRADHDSLPPEIQELWNSNEQRHRRIVIVFNEIKAMADAQPCDRYEKLRILDDLDKTYRLNLEKYDAYVPSATEPAATDAETTPAQSAEAVKAVGAARKTISKYKKVIADNPDDTLKFETAKAKIQAAVNVIKNAGAEFSEATIGELSAIGITFE